MKRVLVLSLVAIFSVSACASAPKKVTLPEETALGTASPEETQKAPAKADAAESNGIEAMTRPILFAYNSSAIESTYAGQLQELAQHIRQTNGKLLVEGHTDERGSTEFNLALGERRANSAKSYLTRLGVPNTNINTISYGEERPVSVGDTESAHARNRRAELVLSN